MASSAQEIIGGVVLTTSVNIYYTGPSNQVEQIQQFVLYNADTVNTHQVQVYFATGNGTPTLADQLGAFTIASGASLSVYQAIGLIVGSGTTIQMQADTEGVITCKASASIITS